MTETALIMLMNARRQIAIALVGIVLVMILTLSALFKNQATIIKSQKTILKNQTGAITTLKSIAEEQQRLQKQVDYNTQHLGTEITNNP